MDALNPAHLVRACVDGATGHDSVCDHAVWAASRLGVALELLHVLEPQPVIAQQVDLSGAVGFGAREALLDELTALDERRRALAAEQGGLLLQGLQQRARGRGHDAVEVRQCDGHLLDVVLDLEPTTRLFVLGQHRPPVAQEAAAPKRFHLDHQVERVIRAVHQPVLVCGQTYRAPRRALIAFDGSATARAAVTRVAASPLLRGMPLTLTMAGHEDESAFALAWAQQTLSEAGYAVDSRSLPGEPEVAVIQALHDEGADLLVIGAYGHSRIRHLIVGSTTTTLLRTSPVPVLVLR